MTRRRRDEQRLSPTDSRKAVLRHRRDRRERQMVLAVLVPVSVLIALFLGFGAYNELWRKPRQPVARVEGEAVTAAQYSKRIQYERLQLLNTLQTFQQFASANDPSFLVNLASGQRANLPQTTVDRMIDEALIRKEAARRDIAVTDADVTEYLAKNDLESVLRPSATPTVTGEPTKPGAPSPTPTPTATSLPADATPPTPTPTVDFTFTADDFDKAFENYIQSGVLMTLQISKSDFYDIVRQRVYRERLNTALGATVPITDKQVELAYLLFNDKATADEAAKALADGATWDAVIEKYGPTPTPTLEPEPAADAPGSIELPGASPEPATDGTPASEESAPASDDDGASVDGTDPAESPASGEATEAATTEPPADEGGDAPPVESDQAFTDQLTSEPAAGTTSTPRAASGSPTSSTAAATPEATDNAGATAGATAAGRPAATGSPTGASATAGTPADEPTGDATSAAGSGTAAPAEPPMPTVPPAPTTPPEPFAFQKGDAEWYTLESLKAKLGLNDTDADKVLAIEKGKPTEAIQTSNGYLVARVNDSDAARALPEDELKTRRDGAVDKWLEEARLAKDAVQRFPFTDLVPAEPEWFVQRYNEFVPSVQAQPTLDMSSIQVSTSAPPAAPAEGGAPAPPAEGGAPAPPAEGAPAAPAGGGAPAGSGG